MWLVALAIPLQGLAAATMLSCGPGHHGMMAAEAMQSAATHDHAAHGHAAFSGEHADDAAGPTDLGASAAAVEDKSAAKDLHQLAKFKCSACAACCITTALPSPTVSFDPPKQTAVFVLPPTVLVAAFLTGGQERPPRPHLA